MTISKTRTKTSRSRVGKIVIACVFASTVGGMFITPISGQAYDNRGGYYEQGRYEHGRYVQGRYVPRKRVYRSPPPRYYYPAPVYAPPPVVYTPAPYQSPGISLFFPFVIR